MHTSLGVGPANGEPAMAVCRRAEGGVQWRSLWNLGVVIATRKGSYRSCMLLTSRVAGFLRRGYSVMCSDVSRTRLYPEPGRNCAIIVYGKHSSQGMHRTPQGKKPRHLRRETWHECSFALLPGIRAMIRQSGINLTVGRRKRAEAQGWPSLS